MVYKYLVKMKSMNTYSDTPSELVSTHCGMVKFINSEKATNSAAADLSFVVMVKSAVETSQNVTAF